MQHRLPCFLVLLSALAAGCSSASSSDEESSAALVAFAASSVEATRLPSACGVTEPPFTEKDRYVLEVVGEPADTLTVKLAAEVVTGAPIALVAVAACVGDGGAVSDEDGAAVAAESASSADGMVQLSLAAATDARPLDASGLRSATVTVQSMPRSDGEPLSVAVQVEFVDGSQLAETYSARLRTAVALCPAPSGAEG